MLNKVQFIGNLGGDPETKVNGEKTVTTFNLATSETYYNDSGDKVIKTQWHRIVAFGKLAELITKYVFKGDKIYLEGKLIHRDYTTDSGDKKYITEVIANEVQFLNTKKNGQDSN